VKARTQGRRKAPATKAPRLRMRSFEAADVVPVLAAKGFDLETVAHLSGRDPTGYLLGMVADMAATGPAWTIADEGGGMRREGNPLLRSAARPKQQVIASFAELLESQ